MPPSSPDRGAAAAPDSRHLVLDAGCTLAEAAALKSRLLLAGSGSDPSAGFPLTVDGSAVARVDTSGLQLLVAFALREAVAGRRLAWKSASPELLRASRQLGLVDVLGLSALAAESG